MPTLEYCYEHADDLAQEVVNAWGVHFGSELIPDFKELLELACRYQSARATADNRRDTLRVISEHTGKPSNFEDSLQQVVARERTMRETFAKAVKEYQDKHMSGDSAKVGK